MAAREVAQMLAQMTEGLIDGDQHLAAPWRSLSQDGA